jgi:hypothetical protein
MLKDAIARARKAVKEAQQNFPVESAAAIEQVYADIKKLNTFINKEIDSIESGETQGTGAGRQKT